MGGFENTFFMRLIDELYDWSQFVVRYKVFKKLDKKLNDPLDSILLDAMDIQEYLEHEEL